MFRGKVRVIHFIGIGGIGMSGIAEVLLNIGFTVTGSDLKDSATVERLRSLGATIFIGHQESNVGDADVVVRSTAVQETNPEAAYALHQGIPLIRRAEMLAELMRMKYGIAVAGTHGKTTTTSMLATCLQAGGIDPTVVIGGRLDSMGGTNARLGTGDYLVAEADESDGTFTLLSPTVTIITNIDPEHLDHYGSDEAMELEFERFANRVPFYGFSVLCLDHPRVQALMPKLTRPMVTYGLAKHADYRAKNLTFDGVCTTFMACRKDEDLGLVTLAMPGQHNVSNALAAIATSMELSIPFDVVQAAMHNFSGVQRRFTVLGEKEGVIYVDDYGHHPVEIDATLKAAEESWPNRRIVAVVQPHRFTRVRDLWESFCSCFNAASMVVLCPIYRAGETPIDGIDHERLALGAAQRGHRGTVTVDSLDAAVQLLQEQVKPGDVVISLGAGDVNKVVNQLFAASA